jgi:hypothetical protein
MYVRHFTMVVDEKWPDGLWISVNLAECAQNREKIPRRVISSIKTGGFLRRMTRGRDLRTLYIAF